MLDKSVWLELKITFFKHWLKKKLGDFVNFGKAQNKVFKLKYLNLYKKSK
jgi:hypothetical protein